MALFETEAIVLRNLKLGEADKIVVALTRQEGVVRGVARGARKLKSRYGASLEPFTIIRLTFFEKETRELVSIAEAEIVKSYFGLTRDDEVFTTLERMTGLILEFAPLRAPDERLYRMLKACLEALEESPELARAVEVYGEIWVLRLSGFLPELTRCAGCRKPFADADAGAATLSAGSAVVCARCAGGQGLTLGRAALCALSDALKLSPREWAGREQRQTDEATRSLLRQALRTLTARALEREPRFRVGAGADARPA